MVKLLTSSHGVRELIIVLVIGEDMGGQRTQETNNFYIELRRTFTILSSETNDLWIGRAIVTNI